jgi:hypothetical protein
MCQSSLRQSKLGNQQSCPRSELNLGQAEGRRERRQLEAVRQALVQGVGLSPEFDQAARWSREAVRINQQVVQRAVQQVVQRAAQQVVPEESQLQVVQGAVRFV